MRVGRDVRWDALRAFDAIFLAQGAGAARRLRLAGEQLAHVFSATDFLVRANLPPEDLPTGQQQQPFVGRRVVVVGGGDTSMDCVRSAVRLGAEHVTLLYRRTDNEMAGPARRAPPCPRRGRPLRIPDDAGATAGAGRRRARD